MNVSGREGGLLKRKKSCAVSEIAGCLWDIKRTSSSLAVADMKAVWCFEDASLLRTDAVYQRFVGAATTAPLLGPKYKTIFRKKCKTQSSAERYLSKSP